MKLRASLLPLLLLLTAAPLTAQVRIAGVSGLPGTFDANSNVCYNKAGTIGFIANSSAGTIRKFHPETGAYFGDTLTLKAPIGPLTLSPNERTLAVVALSTQKIYLIDPETLRTVLNTGYPAESRLESGFTMRNNVQFGPDSSEFFIADPAYGAIAVFRTEGGFWERLLYGFGANPGWLYPVPAQNPSREPDGQLLAVLSTGFGPGDAQYISVLDAYRLSMLDHKDLAQDSLRVQPFNNLEFCASGGWRYLYLPAYDSERLLVYDMNKYGTRLMTPGGASSAGPAKVVTSATGTLMAMVNAKSKDVSLFSLPEAGYYVTIPVPGLSTSSLPEFSKDSFSLYIPSATGEILAYNIRDPKNPVLIAKIPTGQGATVLKRVGDGTIIDLMSSLEIPSNGISLIALNPRTLFLPYLLQSAQEYSGLAIANFGLTSTNVSIMARDNSGALIPGTSNPQIVTIKPGEQLSSVATQLFGFNTKDNLEGSIEAYTSSPEISVLYMSGNVSQTQLDGFSVGSFGAVSEQPSQYLGFSRMTDGVIRFGTKTSTEFLLENPGYVAAEKVEINLHSRDLLGKAVRFSTYRQIPAHGRLRTTLGEFFTLPSYVNDRSYIEVRSDVPLRGLEMVKIGDSRAIIPATVLGGADLTFTAPQFASGGLKYGAAFSSSIAMSNSAQTDIQVEIKVLDKDGNIVPKGAKPFTKTLTPRESLTGTADELLGFPDPLVDPERYEGTLVITADVKGLVVDLLIGDALEGKYLTPEPLNLKEAYKHALAHFAQGDFGFPPKPIYTGVALVNSLARSPATVILEAFTPDGKFLDRATVSLAEGQRFTKTIGQPELFPNIKQQGAGTIRITSSVPILAWEVFGSGDFLVAVTPMQIAP